LQTKSIDGQTRPSSSRYPTSHNYSTLIFPSPILTQLLPPSPSSPGNGAQRSVIDTPGEIAAEPLDSQYDAVYGATAFCHTCILDSCCFPNCQEQRWRKDGDGGSDVDTYRPLRRLLRGRKRAWCPRQRPAALQFADREWVVYWGTFHVRKLARVSMCVNVLSLRNPQSGKHRVTYLKCKECVCTCSVVCECAQSAKPSIWQTQRHTPEGRQKCPTKT